MLECLVALSILTIITLTIQPVLQVVQRSRKTESQLEMVQAGLPILTSDIETASRCAIQNQSLRLEFDNYLGVVVDVIRYNYSGQQLLRQKNGGYERMMAELKNVKFSIEANVLTVILEFSHERYRFKMNCPT
ncbi:MAG: competence type IV pilus minor pilin ComGF [Culicoidibacterales bacterium]